MKKTFFALFTMFFLPFSKVEVSDNCDKREAYRSSIFSDYDHSQKSVVNWNGYGAYRSFLKMAEKKFVVPGLSESFVPQGIAFCESMNSFMLSGYADDGGAAYIITVDYNSGRINGDYKILNTDGTDFTGHSGGIAVYGRYVYVADGYFLYYISTQKFTSGTNEIEIDGIIRLPCAASFISIYDGYLWAGNFYHRSFAKNYDVSLYDKYNRVYRSIILGYRFNSEYEGAIRLDDDKIESTAVPYVALCAPSEVQGIAFLSNGDVHLSTSYGRTVMSMQRLYDYPLKHKCDRVVKIGGRDLPVWFLNDDLLKRAITTFPMSEGVVHRDGKIYIVFESGAKKYRSNALDPTDCVWEMRWK